MSDQFIGEIRPFAFGVIPKGWLACQGQLLPINQNQPLFALIGITYGGDGAQTFALPDLRGRVAVSSGTPNGGPNYGLGQFSGEQSHVLLLNETPQHLHGLNGNNNASGVGPTPSTSTSLGVTSGPSSGSLAIYGTGSAPKTLAAEAVGNQGSGQGHENRMPYLAVNFCIAIQGIFPSRN